MTPSTGRSRTSPLGGTGNVRIGSGMIVPGVPELHLLLQCARVSPSPANPARIHELIDSGIDWTALQELARQHKMLPLLAMHLREQGGRVPSEVHDMLRDFQLRNTRWVLQVISETVQVLTRLEEEGIAAVPYKGPVLGAQLYGNVALRHAGDIDVLVRRQDVDRVVEVLQELDYRPRHTLRPGTEAFVLRSRYSQMFDGDSPFPVELHWAFTNGDVAFSLDLEGVWENLDSIVIGRNRFPTFGVEDLLLILCVHGAKHRWARLEWICGVAEAVARARGADWGRLIERATERGVRRMLLLGLLLAHDLLEAPVPPAVLHQARADRILPRLAAQVPPLLLAPGGTGGDRSLATDLFRFRLRERWKDRARFIWYRITTPSDPEEWGSLTIRGRMVPVHGFTRPFRILAKLGSGIRSSLMRGTRQ